MNYEHFKKNFHNPAFWGPPPPSSVDVINGGPQTCMLHYPIKIVMLDPHISELDRFCTEETRPDSGGRGGHRSLSRVPCVVTGDFNSQPGSLLHAFLAGGAVDYAGLFRHTTAALRPGWVNTGFLNPGQIMF